MAIARLIVNEASDLVGQVLAGYRGSQCIRQLMRQPSRYYFFLLEPKAGCHAPAFMLGAAASVLTFSFLGFLASRLPFCLPLAMPISL